MTNEWLFSMVSLSGRGEVEERVDGERVGERMEGRVMYIPPMTATVLFAIYPAISSSLPLASYY